METKDICIRYGVIYKCTCIKNNKIYIGQTKHSLESRKNEHEKGASKNSHMIFLRAIKKYGKENFKWEIIDSAQTKEELNFKEKFYIIYYNSGVNNGKGYNVASGGVYGFNSDFCTESKKRSISTKRKKSLKNTWKNLSEKELQLVTNKRGKYYD